MGTLLDDEIDPSAKYLTRPNKATVEIEEPTIVTEPVSTGKSKIDLENLNADLKERIDHLKTLWKEDKQLNPKGADLPITSGARTKEEQRDLYRRMLRGDPGIYMAQNPDKYPLTQSFHNHAIDLLPNVPNSLLEKVGLHRPFGDKDPVHVEINPNFKYQKQNLEKTSALIEDDVDPYAKYVQQQGTYVEPKASTTQTMQTEYEKLKNDLTSSEFYKNKLPKQAAALYDTLYGTVPSAINFVGTPFAKLADLSIQGYANQVAGKPVVRENSATKALTNLTDTMQRPLGKAFGITQDPAYTGEASQRIMQFVGENMDKGASYLSEKTGLPKADIEWYMNAAMIGGTPGAIRGAKKGVEIAKELPGKTKEMVENKFPSLMPETNPNLRNVGAAEVPKVEQRINNARSLLEPIDLPRDIATREFADINYAREKAKDPVVGDLLRKNYAKINEQVIRNFDKEIIATGADLTGIERSELGQTLNDVVGKYKTDRYKTVQDKYTAADTAGETLQEVPYKSVLDYIADKRPTVLEQNPILKQVKEELEHNDPNKTGSISLRQMEDIRQLITSEVEPGTSNGFHGKKIIQDIDSITKGKGGKLYQEARTANHEYMKEFEETPSIRNITSLKKNLTERIVPIETIAEKIMLGGPRSHIVEVFKTLDKAGPEGQALINELRGVVGEQIKNEALQSPRLDVNGNPTVSADKLNKIITKLDKSGKLELIFGKQGAERYRTLNEVSKDIYTVPEGSVNTSNTASTIKGYLADIGASYALSGIPAPIAHIGIMGKNEIVKRRDLNRINEFINYGKEQK